MAQLGTGVQLEARGPQNVYLESPQASLFLHDRQRSTRFAAEARDTLPLQTVQFGGQAVFELAHDGDMLGDMHLQIRVPAVQPELGEGLATVEAPGTAGEAQPAGMPALGRVALTLVGSEAATGESRFMSDGQGYVFTYDLGGGVAWRADLFYSGIVRSTLTGPADGPERQLRVSVSGVPKAVLRQRVGLTTVAYVSPAGAVTARNDEWRSPLAYMLMRRVRFVVDGLVLHDHERLFYDVADRLTARAGHAAGLDAMLGRGLSMGRPHTLHLPLKFMCCSGAPGKRAFFPLVLLPTSRVVVDLAVEAFSACVPAAPLGPPPAPPASLDVRLVADHVWLDAAERNTLLLSGAVTMMLEGVQDMDGMNYSEAAVDGGGRPVPTRYVTVDLSELNLPVRALAWVVYEESAAAAAPFQYLDAVEEATLLFGTTERETGSGAWFAKRQVWGAAGRCAPGDNVHALSFALEAWPLRGVASDPSGACNFSLVQKPALRLRLGAGGASRRLKCKVFGLTYNWLTFEKGHLRQAFSV